jgi:hypothetical protein
LPLVDAHRVTLSQLLALHKEQQQQDAICASTAAVATNGVRPVDSRPSAKQNDTVPLMLRRALPGIKAHDYNRVKRSSLFLLSGAFVCESAAVLLLKVALEVCSGRPYCADGTCGLRESHCPRPGYRTCGPCPAVPL